MSREHQANTLEYGPETVIDSPKGVANQEKKPPSETLEFLYRRTLCRPPTKEEAAPILAVVEKEEDKRAIFEDVFWALLNSKEFIFNH